MSTIIPPKMAIQTIQVRGGTLNSPRLEFLSSSLLNLLSSGILTASLTVAQSYHAQPKAAMSQLNPLPPPLQAVFGRGCKLKPFRNPQTLYPENLATPIYSYG